MMLPFTGFINTTNNFDFELHTTKPTFISKGVVGNRSSTAAQFTVSSQKPSYDFNFKRDVSKPIVCFNILA
jgi:hypothetical protein